MKPKHAFSLGLFLLYFLLFSIISCCLLQLIVTCIIPSLRSTQLFYQQIKAHTSLDFFVHEIRTSHIKVWKKINATELVFNNGEKDIGWRFHDHVLKRSEGVYDKKWKKKYTSTVLHNVESLIFKEEYKNGHIIGINLTLILTKNVQSPIEIYVAVRNYE